MCNTVHSELFFSGVFFPNLVGWWHLALGEWAGHSDLFILCGGWDVASPRPRSRPVKRAQPTTSAHPASSPLRAGCTQLLLVVGTHEVEQERVWEQEGTARTSPWTKAIKGVSKCLVCLLWLLEGKVRMVLVLCNLRGRQDANWALTMCRSGSKNLILITSL